MKAKSAACVLSVGTMLAAAAPVFAGPPQWAPAHGYRAQNSHPVVVQRAPRPAAREIVVRRPVATQRAVRRVAVQRPVYVEHPVAFQRPVPAPRRVVRRPARYSESVYYGAPAYVEPRRDPTLGIIGGAVIGAVIGSQIGHGPDRTAATAVGAVLGGLIGSGM